MTEGRSSPLGDLVVSMLAVNSFPLEKAYSLLFEIQQAGLDNPEMLRDWDEAEIARRLYQAGYRRGPFMSGLMSKRLASLGHLLNSEGVDSVLDRISTRDRTSVERFLLTQNGIGPRVVKNFLTLRDPT